MKKLPILASVCALALCSCATLPQRDRNLLQQHGVAGPLNEKMLHQEPLAIPDIIELSHRGLPVPFIIHYLHSTYFVYTLNTGDVLHLKQSGVSPEIIDYLLSTPSQYAPQPAPYGYPYDPYGFGYYYSPYFYPGVRYHRW